MKANKWKPLPRVSRQPSPELMHAVYAAFDPDMLATICTTWDFTHYATKVDLDPAPRSSDRFYWYQDNGSPILAVAHLDSVQDDITCQVVDTAAGPLVVCPALDDRLGAYVILELLPSLGFQFDILLTTDEEIGRSTAEDFAEDFTAAGKVRKQYNWIIEFDRGGTDVVMYDFETDPYVGLVEAAGAHVGMGSFSDICCLEDLGCAAFNWGVGYEDYHGPRAHAWLADTFRMVARFINFHAANAATHLPHQPSRGLADWRDDDSPIIDMIQADCGHLVDLNDDSDYVENESDDGAWGIVCADCSPISNTA